MTYLLSFSFQKHDEDKFEWNCEIETLKNQMTSCEKEKVGILLFFF